MLTVVPKYYAVPTQAGFGSVRPGDVPPTRTIEVRAAEAGTDFRVTGASVDGTGFVAGEPRRLEKGWGVDVRYDGKAREAGRVEATLVVTVDDPDLPRIRIPLVATATGR